MEPQEGMDAALLRGESAREEVDRVTDLLDSSDAGPAAIRGSALRAGGYAAGLLLALGSAPLLFRHLGVDDFGRYQTVIALVTLAAGFSEGGVNAIALREWSTRPPGERERVMANLLGVRIVLTLVAAAGAVLFAVVAGYSAAMVAGTAVAGIALLAQTVQTLLANPLQAELRFGWATVADLLRQVTLVACLIALIVAGAGIVPLLGAQIPSALAALALTVWLVRTWVPLRPRADRKVWVPLLRDALPFALAIAVNIAYFRVGLLFLSIADTPTETGYYATSFRIIEVIVMVPPVLLAAAFPILARAAHLDAERFTYATRRVFEVALTVGGLAVVCLELGAGEAVRLLAGPGYEPAAPILRIMAPTALATFASVACAYPLLSLRRHREVLVASSVGMAVTLAGLFALATTHGAKGAAVATLIAEVAVATTMALLLLRARPSVELPIAALVWVGIAAAPALAVLLIPGLPAVADVVLGAVIYVGVLAVAGRIPRELLDAIRRR
jgi:O-antigen/teichoic acid export membrane protein